FATRQPRVVRMDTPPTDVCFALFSEAERHHILWASDGARRRRRLPAPLLTVRPVSARASRRPGQTELDDPHRAHRDGASSEDISMKYRRPLLKPLAILGPMIFTLSSWATESAYAQTWCSGAYFDPYCYGYPYGYPYPYPYPYAYAYPYPSVDFDFFFFDNDRRFHRPFDHRFDQRFSHRFDQRFAPRFDQRFAGPGRGFSRGSGFGHGGF